MGYEQQIGSVVSDIGRSSSYLILQLTHSYSYIGNLDILHHYNAHNPATDTLKGFDVRRQILGYYPILMLSNTLTDPAFRFEYRHN
jgi:hypothetical protein